MHHWSVTPAVILTLVIISDTGMSEVWSSSSRLQCSSDTGMSEVWSSSSRLQCSSEGYLLVVVNMKPGQH